MNAASPATSDVRVVPAGDAALVVEFEARIDPLVNARVIALADAIRAAALDGVRDVVPTYRSVTVYFDPLRTAADDLSSRLAHEAARAGAQPDTSREPIRIPVCYGGTFGPDLAHVAGATGLTEDEVIARHCGAMYRVYMLGFVPGFAYLGSVDPRIAVPRHATPRTRVVAGSVGIAGEQTGIYPADTPGGWQIIGRTPLRPFDPRRLEPFLLKPGDAVRFQPIAREAFEALAAEAGADG